jgi:hypothetical protein
MSNFNQLCLDCGFVANHLTMLKRHGSKSITPVNTGNFGAWQGLCDICAQEKTVTSVRDFFYPAERAMRFVRQYIQKGGES